MRASKPPQQSPQKRERCPQDMFDPILRDWARSFPSVDVRYRHQLTRFQAGRARRRRARARPRHRTHDRDRNAVPDRLRRRRQHGREGDRRLDGRQAGPLLHHQHHLPRAAVDVAARQGRSLPVHHPGHRKARGRPSSRSTASTAGACRSSTRRPKGSRREQIEAAIRRAVGIDFAFEILSVTSWTRRELVATSYQSRPRLHRRRCGARDVADRRFRHEHRDRRCRRSGLETRRDVARLGRRWSLGFVHGRAAAGGGVQRPRVQREPGAHALARPQPCALRRYRRPAKRAGPRSVRPSPKRCATSGTRSASTSAIATMIRRSAGPTERRHRRKTLRTYVQESRAGARAPHVWLRDGRSTLDLFGLDFVLLRFTAAPRRNRSRRRCASAACRCGVVELADEPAAVAAYAAPLVLVRPDGHVAWRTPRDPAPFGSAQDKLRRGTAGTGSFRRLRPR